MSLLTKVAKGIAYGDVSNVSVRNVLTEISKKAFGGITEQEMHDTLEDFEWKCPYTGKDLKNAIENRLGGYAIDHICPQNKKYCGLNIKGNLVFVDKEANNEKGDKSIEEFFNNQESRVLAGVSQKDRNARLDKIKDFQKKCGYDPSAIQKIVSPLLNRQYDEIRKNQEAYIANAINEIKQNGIKTIVPNKKSKIISFQSTKKHLPDISLYVANKKVDENTFKTELLNKKKATFKLIYDSGAVKESPWKAERFDINSSVMSNIQSRPFWRSKTKEGLTAVEVIID